MNPRPLSLSKLTATKVNWTAIEDSVGSLSSRYRGKAVAPTDTAITPDDRIRITEAFATAKRHFDVALSALRVNMRIVIAISLVACAATIAGGVLSQLSPSSALLSLAGVGTLIATVRQIWLLGRDQALLELVPVKYGLAVELCRTHAEVQKLLEQFIAETVSLRK